MKDKKGEVTRVNVKIFGEDYVVKGTEDPEYIQMLAAYVDRKMQSISQRMPNLPATKVAVLAALNLADELSKLQEDYDELVRKLEEVKSGRMGS